MGSRKFSLYDIEQFIREAGAEKITEDAVVGLEKEIEKLAERIADRAMKYAEHAGRKKLIRTSDIMLTGKPEMFSQLEKP
ncbi:MAG: NFYB/HAP3 family transcription factor subunit [Candidatus Micrarchaeaceae archaeon]